MARERSPNRDKAFEIFKKNNGSITNREIAKLLEEDEKVIAVWKSRDKWNLNINVVQQSNKSCTTKENNRRSKFEVSNEADLNGSNKNETRSHETNSQNPKARYGNKNASGNAGGNGGPPGNKKAEIHGLYAKYLPEETMELIELIKSKDRLDILWEQIVIQYAAIIRAQKIMYVTDKDEMIKELKKEESSEYGQKTEWEFQFTWDRQASFLNAQSRAMSELRSLIKQYDTMVNANWDLVTDEQKHRVEKLKLEISNIRGDSKDNSTENWVNSIKAIAEKRKNERK